MYCRHDMPKRFFQSKWLKLCRDFSQSPSKYPTKLKVYSRLSNSTVDVVTKHPNIVTWYSCGPTVYDSPHLGHACSYMQFDLIRKIMENCANLNVVMLMSVTDVDDKIIARAANEGCNFTEISSKFEKEFTDAMAALGVAPPSLALRVTDHIPDIIGFIERILSRGLAYIGKDGSVYFSVQKYPSYGRLAPAQEERESPAEKKSSLDFALWKAAKPGEPSWDSPWGHGRPGWHIECSAMASKYFGDSVDFHSGGIDLLFPHHENEEAQSCAHHGCQQWVNYWLHSGHLHLSGDVKMSKSLKNTVSVWDFLDEYTPNHLRTLCMLVPYRNGSYSATLIIEKYSTH
ncbi:unnamed protein product [Nesidiocoris tenuis]|uniref:cysteine--tRNA ligase n=1 Tax=Nesidiocoris tenuis TaxID=355587 RepID=A0A6H5H0S2_9HEMI|nr:unnamed protein product [Nesidiocoris tenuis]